MKFRKRLLIPPSLLLALGLLAGASAFGGGAPPTSADAAKPKGLGLPPYMVAAAGIDNPEYLSCISSKVKKPALPNLLANFQRALDCQTSKN